MRAVNPKTEIEVPQKPQTIKKFTIVPVPIDFEDALKTTPLTSIQEDLTFEEISQLLPSGAFELWKDYISLEERKRLTSFSHAFVHRFSGQLGNDKEDAKSKSFMHLVFICLRLIKPLRKSFQFIQAYEQNNSLEVYSFSHPPITEMPQMPVTQTLNRVTSKDLDDLQKLLPRFLAVAESGTPFYLQRAIRFYEQGYSSTTESSLQLISWMIGIESILSKGETQLTPAQLEVAIRQGYGAINIKQPQWRPFLEASDPIRVESVSKYLLELRNSLVHARPIPDYLREPSRDHLGQTHELSEYLIAGAAMILQSAILQELSKIEPGPV